MIKSVIVIDFHITLSINRALTSTSSMVVLSAIGLTDVAAGTDTVGVVVVIVSCLGPRSGVVLMRVLAMTALRCPEKCLKQMRSFFSPPSSCTSCSETPKWRSQ